MPPVRSLDELYSSFNPVYDPQRQNINQQIGQQNQSLPELEKGLYAAKDNAFRDISQMAANKGMTFSGYSPNQQARYVGEKFLPALTGLRGQVQGNIARLQSALLDIDSNQRKEAMTTRESDLGKLYNWQQTQDQRKYQEEQDRVAYEREMNKLRTQINAKNKAQPTVNHAEEFAATLASAAGADGKVSPGDYNALKNQWVASGYGDYKSFHDNFWRFVNDSHWWDYK